jgi:O-antigen/teichoic acid export membrane protein
MSLKKKTIGGLMWTTASKMSMQLVLFIVNIILARILDKGDFGIAGMAMLVTVAISLVNDSGLGTAIVQRQEISEGQKSSLFWGGLVFGLLLFSIALLGSGPLADFFKKPQARPVFMVQALGFIVGSFGIVHKAQLVRAMNFKRLSLIEMTSMAVSGAVAITLALTGAGVWSLVLNLLMRDTVVVILVWLFSTWRPQFHFRWKEFKELFGFSAKVLGNDMAILLNTNADISLVGRILGAQALGSYSLALNLVKLPVTQLSGIVSKVAFPAFASVQSDLPTFRRGFRTAIMYISMITFPVLIGLGVFAHEFILLFLGAKWMDMVWPLILLVPMAMLKSVGTIKGSVLKAVGHPEIEFWWNVAYLLPLAGVIYIGTRYGLVGVSAAFTTLYLLTFPIIQTMTNRQVHLTNYDFLVALKPATIGAGLMLLTGLGFRWANHSVLHWGTITFFVSGLFLSSSVYLFSLWLFQRRQLHALMQVFGDMRQNNKPEKMPYEESDK